ncbi:hypothetical protein HELRODRAFT_184212 [Helobdella robusta]|uniref:Uncharacterized protein n=1 Tax=Helobdella robusta TaxID=6412 RepID=T1FKS0_HELRO|nr:hypothetical protein HELRODRAFT_184212 [Helobdella robusta]ESO05142.1 hypothetical protein HELRODRAFT_184212 [Helobdella robusta]
MAAKRVCIAEILWFLLNNQENINDVGFKLEVVEFYTNDEILNGKKILLTEIEGLKKDIIKLTARGNTKYDKRIESVNSASILSGDNVDNCASKKSWADRTAKRYTSQSESCDEIVGDDGFQVVRSKKRKKSSTSPQLTSPKPASKPASKQMKTYGTGISCPLKASKIIEEKITYYIGNVSTCNKNIIEDHLKQNNIAFLQCFPVLPADWTPLMNDRNLDNTCLSFYNIINNSLELFAPFQTYKPRNKKSWITNDILKMSNKQYKLY